MLFVFVASAFAEFLAAFDPWSASVWFLEGKVLHLLLLVIISVDVINTIDTIGFIGPINNSGTGRCFAVHLLFRITPGRYFRWNLIVLIFVDGRRSCIIH